MRLLLDENLSVVTARLLREAGHDVVEIVDVAKGAPDPDVIALARATDRLLVSFDSDIGERLFRHGDPTPPGVVFLRFVQASPDHTARVLLDLLDTSAAEIARRFVTVEADRTRVRPLP